MTPRVPEGSRGAGSALLPHGQAPRNRLQSSPRDTSSLEAADRDGASRTHGDGRQGGLALGSGAGRATRSPPPTPPPATPSGVRLKNQHDQQMSPRTVSKLRLAFRGSLRAWKGRHCVSASRSLQRPTLRKAGWAADRRPQENQQPHEATARKAPPRADSGGEFPGPAGPTCLSRRPSCSL